MEEPSSQPLEPAAGPEGHEHLLQPTAGLGHDDDDHDDDDDDDGQVRTIAS